MAIRRDFAVGVWKDVFMTETLSHENFGPNLLFEICTRHRMYKAVVYIGNKRNTAMYLYARPADGHCEKSISPATRTAGCCA